MIIFERETIPNALISKTVAKGDQHLTQMIIFEVRQHCPIASRSSRIPVHRLPTNYPTLDDTARHESTPKEAASPNNRALSDTSRY
jgi:hypothetical protein